LYQDLRKERKIKVNLPPFSQQNHDSTMVFGQRHFHELSVKLFLVHIHDVILPKLVKDTTTADPAVEQYKRDLESIAGQVWSIISEYKYAAVCLNTASSKNKI
jgi:hypothetical protein